MRTQAYEQTTWRRFNGLRKPRAFNSVLAPPSTEKILVRDGRRGKFAGVQHQQIKAHSTDSLTALSYGLAHIQLTAMDIAIR